MEFDSNPGPQGRQSNFLTHSAIAPPSPRLAALTSVSMADPRVVRAWDTLTVFEATVCRTS